MKKNGQMYQASNDIISPIDGKNLGEFVVFYYAKVDKDLYLIVLDNIFKKDPYKRKFSFVNEKKFRSMVKGCKLQVAE